VLTNEYALKLAEITNSMLHRAGFGVHPHFDPGGRSHRPAGQGGGRVHRPGVSPYQGCFADVSNRR